VLDDGTSARAEHLQSWPNDLGGAETAASLAGHGNAAQALSRLYADALDWACELLAERPRKRRLFQRALRQRSAGLNRQVELPPLVREDLRRSGERFGWPA